MRVSELETDRILDLRGAVVIDPALANPMPSLEPALTGMTENASIMNKTEYDAILEDRRGRYGGSGQSDQELTFEEFVSADKVGSSKLFHTKSSPYNAPLVNALAFPLDARQFSDRRNRVYFNIDGRRIRYDEFGGNHVDAPGSSTFPLTAGIEFGPTKLPKVEANSTVTVNAYEPGDMALLTDVNRELLPFGNFATDTGNVTPWTNTLVSVVYDTVNTRYTLTPTPTATVASYAKIAGFVGFAHTEYRIRFDITSSNNSAIAPRIFVRQLSGLGVGIEDIPVNVVSGNTYELLVTPAADIGFLLISPNSTFISGYVYELDNVSIVATEPSQVLCVNPIAAGGSIVANNASFVGNPGFGTDDFVFIECWEENVADTGMVYPLGNVQYYGNNSVGITGIAEGTFTGADTYSLFGNWQPAGGLIGKGYIWSNLTTAQKTALSNNPDNNLYLDGTVLMQTRYRTRVVRGVVGKWMHTDRLDYQYTGSAVHNNDTTRYLRLQGKSTTVTDLGVDTGNLAYIGNNYGNTIGTYGNTATQAVPLLMAQRRNQGIYDPTYNPNGCAKTFNTIAGVTADKFAYEVTTIASTADCFDPAKIAMVGNSTVVSLASVTSGVSDPLVYLQTGLVASGVSGRVDGLYADEINVRDLEDLRMDATKVTDTRRYLDTEFNKLTQGIARGVSNEIMFKQIGPDVLKTGDVISSTTWSAYGKYGYLLRASGTAAVFDTAPIFGVDNNYGLLGSNTDVLVIGSNGASLPVLHIAHPLHPDGHFHIAPHKPDSAAAVVEFNTLFPIGTTLKYYATVHTSTKHSGSSMVCDIIGDVANYPAHWLTDGVFGSPMFSDQNDNLLTLSGSRLLTKGGYRIPLKKKINSAAIYPPAVRVLATTNGVTTELSHVVDSIRIINAGTAIGYYLSGADNSILFNLTGTGAHDAAIEAATVIQVFYNTEAEYTKSALAGVVVAEGDGYTSNHQNISNGNALTGMLTGKVSTSTVTNIAGAVSQELIVTPIPTNATGHTDNQVWMYKPKHTTLAMPGDVVSSTKMLPYLTTHESVAELNIMYKEARYKSMDVLAANTFASDAQANDRFGVSVAISGNRLVVGAFNAGTVGVSAGKVYVYDWNGSAYIEVAQLTASVPHTNDHFGASVALSSDSNRLIVGAHGADTAAVDTGKVYIFDWNGSAYIEGQQLTASVPRAGDWFGVSVALSGIRLVVGASGVDSTGINTGRVYAYDWNGSSYIEVTQLAGSNGVAYDQFGISVAVSGNRLVVGAYGVDTAALDAGKVYVYKWNAVTSAYDEVITLLASDAQAYDLFGNSVALSSDSNRLIVGAPGADTTAVDAGKVYVYDWNGSAYIEGPQLTAYDAQAIDWFGRSVALSGNKLVVGATGEDTKAVTAGKVYSLNLYAEMNPGLPAIQGTWGDNDVFELTLAASGMQDTNDQLVRYGTKAVKLKRFLK